MKKVCTLILALVLTSIMNAPAEARGNANTGKKIFSEKCHICHARGGKGGELDPASKTQRQWRRFFKRTQHRDLPRIWKDLNREEREHLWLYMYQNALDSDKPATCG